jgi:serine/threonine-protein kinase
VNALREPPRNEARAAVRTLLICDLVASTRLVERIGDSAAAELLTRHDRLARELLRAHDGREIDKSDGFLFLFERPIEAVRFALAYQQQVASLVASAQAPLSGRVGIHLGEVILRENPPEAVRRGAKLLEVEGLAKAIAARVMSLAAGGRILLTRAAFDVARRSTVGEEIGERGLRWLAHGRYRFAGVDEPLEVFEVAPVGGGELLPPADSEKCQRVDDAATIVGWRPAPGLEVPGRANWILGRRIAEGGFGEVWLATQRKTREPRVFKFCYDAQSLSGLRREISLFRLLKEALGDRRDIARILDWNLDSAPFFIESEYTPGGNVREWIEERGGFAAIPLATRLEIAAQVAEALGAAHSVGVLHKDLKPANVLISTDAEGRPRAQLTDFGIGLLLDRGHLAAAGITFRTELFDASRTSASGGTLGYLAPELLEGKPATLQADIYALGVLIYQLAIGDFSHLIAPGWEEDVEDELLRADIAAMVDGHPERRPASAPEIAQRLRSLDARHAARQAERRARADAEEMRRRLERSLRRRRIWMAAAAGLLGVASVTGFQALRIAQEAERANRAAATAERVSSLLVRLFETSDPGESRGAEVTAREVLERGAKRLEEELGTEPAVLARMLGVLGRVYQNLGDHSRSEQLLEKAVALGAEHLPELALAELEHDLANTYWFQDRFAEAEPIYERVIETRRTALGAEHPATLLAQSDLASLYQRTGRQEECERLAKAVLGAAKRSNPVAGAADAMLSQARLVAAGVLFHLYTSQGRLDEAESSERASLAWEERTRGRDHPQVLVMRHNLATLLVDRRRYAEAEALLREILADSKRVLGPSHRSSNLARYWLACSLVAQGKRAEALTLVTEAVRAGYAPKADSAQVCIDILQRDPRIWGALSSASPGPPAPAGEAPTP